MNMKKNVLLLFAVLAIVSCSKGVDKPDYDGAPLEGPFVDLISVPKGADLNGLKTWTESNYPQAVLEFEYDYALEYKTGETEIYFHLQDEKMDWCSAYYYQKDLGMKEIVDLCSTRYGHYKKVKDVFFPSRSMWIFDKDGIEVTCYYRVASDEFPNDYCIAVEYI